MPVFYGFFFFFLQCQSVTNAEILALRGVEWVHGLFLFPLVLGKM